MATAKTILANAKRYLGMPYVWGGDSKAEGGFDCSGYVYNVLRDSGYPIGRRHRDILLWGEKLREIRRSREICFILEVPHRRLPISRSMPETERCMKASVAVKIRNVIRERA